MKKILPGFGSLLLILTNVAVATAQSYVPERNNTAVKIKPVIPVKAYAFDLKDVRLTNSIFSKAMSLDSAYLLYLKPDRLLHRFRGNAGLKPKDSVYGGWEKAGVSGHSLGHYLSACAMMYAASGNAAFKERVNYIVDELAVCQQKRKTGYVGAIPNEDTIFAQIGRGDIRTDAGNLNGGWVPWYTIHKVMAGLADAYLYCDNKTALTVLTKFADWIGTLTKNMDEAQWQTMLKEEHGGMNETLANLYSITGNKKYLVLAEHFYHKVILDPLSQRKDELAGKHANTQIPKVLGMARLYELTADHNAQTIADYFWDEVIHQHSYVIGGNSDYEHFTQPGKLNDHLSTNTTETCNTYNMLKLTRHLFAWEPQAAYMDYYERALYNHILASQNSADGMTCYYVPLLSGTRKQYSTPEESFWCCTGTGMENHVKYGEQIYAEGTDGSLYVNLFIPSVLQWKAKQLSVEQQTSYPASDQTKLIFHSKRTQSFSLRIRKPAWANEITLAINGQQQKAVIDETGFIVINRAWKNNDVIGLMMPMKVYAEAMPDNPNKMAFLYGPLVLAGKLPGKATGNASDIPVMVADKTAIPAALEKTVSKLTFQTAGITQPYDINMIPFYAMNSDRQVVYFDVYNNQQWQQRKAEIEAENQRLADLEKRTTDEFRIGEMQPERDHNLQGEKTFSGEMGETKWRDARDGGWFSFDLQLSGANVSYLLQNKYWGSDKGGRKFDILVNGEKIATEELTGAKPNQFILKEYLIPVVLTAGKKMVTVKIQSYPDNTAGGIFGVRIIQELPQ